MSVYSKYTVPSHCGSSESFTISFTLHIEAVERFTYCGRLNAFKNACSQYRPCIFGLQQGIYFSESTVFSLIRVTNAMIQCGCVLLQCGHMLRPRWHSWKLRSSGKPTNNFFLFYICQLWYSAVFFALSFYLSCITYIIFNLLSIQPNCVSICDRQTPADKLTVSDTIYSSVSAA